MAFGKIDRKISMNKIFFVCTQMESGGVQTRAVKMARKMRDQGIDARVLFLYRKRNSFPADPSLIVLSESKPKSPMGILGIFWRLYRYLRTEKPAAVVGMAQYGSQLGAIIAAVAGIKTRVGTQANPPKTMPKAAQILDLLCGNLGIYTSNIAASKSVFNDFSNFSPRYKKTLKLIYNGVEIQPSEKSKIACRERFGIPDDKFVILNCGRLSYQKNQEFLIKSLVELNDTYLAILGDGELRAHLTEVAETYKVAHRVKLIAEIPNQEIPDFLNAGDVFAFPSRFEAFGLALVEAMSVGLPVIVSDYDAIVEVVGDAGAIFNQGNQSQFVGAVKALAGSEALRREMGEKARLRSKSFSFDAMLNGFIREALGPK